MPNITVKEIFNISKTALSQHGALDWVAEEVAEAVAASESVGNRICGLYYGGRLPERSHGSSRNWFCLFQ